MTYAFSSFLQHAFSRVSLLLLLGLVPFRAGAQGVLQVAASDGLYSDRVEITWQPINGVTEYRVFRSESFSGEKTDLGLSTNGKSFSDYTVPEATPFATYYYWVQPNQDDTVTEYDTGWRSPKNRRIYRMTPKNCQLEVVEGSSLKLTGTSAQSTLKIRYQATLPKGVVFENGVGVDSKTSDTYVVCAVVPRVDAAGHMGKIYTEAPIWQVEVTESLSDLTAKNCYVVGVSASAFKTITMSNPSTLWTSGTLIQANGQWVQPDFKMVTVSLTGVGLDRIQTPDQSVKVRTSTVKRRNPAKVYTLYPAHVYFVEGKALNIQTTGASIVGDVLAHAKLNLLNATRLRFTPQFPDYVGGCIGTVDLLTSDTETTTGTATYRRFVSGLNTEPSTDLDIVQVQASRSIVGVFMAGATGVAEGTITPTCATDLKSVKTRPEVKIVGEYWASDFEPKLKGGDFSGFVRRTPGN
ncbi:MAG TPA: hypothetical protein PLA90_04120 [Candidatus Sumerlaeota bacterium]|nr:hypothetical protein [Candidatus Sumerlaeota bacterium]HPS00706.1 hypothetical protein [Candidatus Sumerlaeota bacterium]